MASSYIAIDRRVFDHPIFDKQPFGEREAWIWLISECAWKKRERRIGDYVVRLERGQVAASVRHLAQKWLWHRSKVERYLARLEKQDMIRTSSETGVTIITVCNYNKYQGRRDSRKDIAETSGETDARQMRDRCETIQNQETKKEINQRKKDAAYAAPVVLEDEKPSGQSSTPAAREAECFSRGKEVLGSTSGGMIVRLIKTKGSVELARAAIEMAATKQNPREYIGAIIRGQDHLRASAWDPRL